MQSSDTKLKYTPILLSLDKVARRNHSEGMKSVLQFAELCRRLEVHTGTPTQALDTHVTHAAHLCQAYPQAHFMAYWGQACADRCVFGWMNVSLSTQKHLKC